MTYALTIRALDDGTRRAIVERLRVRPRSVTELARDLPVSQPAVSQHLGVLRAAGLVSVRRDGRRSVYSLRRAGLASLRSYLEGMWDDALAAYAASFGEDPEGEAD